jgi:hypothetical protein
MEGENPDKYGSGLGQAARKLRNVQFYRPDALSRAVMPARALRQLLRRPLKIQNFSTALYRRDSCPTAWHKPGHFFASPLVLC